MGGNKILRGPGGKGRVGGGPTRQSLGRRRRRNHRGGGASDGGSNSGNREKRTEVTGRVTVQTQERTGGCRQGV